MAKCALRILNANANCCDKLAKDREWKISVIDDINTNNAFVLPVSMKCMHGLEYTRLQQVLSPISI